MKKNFQLVALIFAFVLWQGCGSKTKENNTESEADKISSDSVAAAQKKADDAAAKRADRERVRKETDERRMQAAAARAKTGPTYKDKSGHVVYNVAETAPTYSGGTDAMNAYLKSNLKYPDEAKDQGIEGTVYVDFVVGADGKVRDIEATDVVGDVNQTLKDEAVRVVSSMPAWVSGKQNGKAVDTRFGLPITFDLAGY